MRRIVSRDFAPRAARLLRPRIAELAQENVGGVARRGECDLVTDVAGPLPSYMIAELMDIPHADGVALFAAVDKVVMYYGAANRDPEQFADPDRLDLRRSPNNHLALGGGPHLCLGGTSPAWRST